jgi:thiol:disulfide interchange protein
MGLWTAAWGVAAIASVIAMRSPGILMFAWNFPIGLPGLFVSSRWDPAHPMLILIAGWLLYLGLTFYGLKRRDRAGYFLAYLILIIILALNVAGCRAVVSHIHIPC